MKINIYRIFDIHGGYSFNRPDCGVWEKWEITIPDEIIYGYNMFGEMILLLNGIKYVLCEVLSEWGGKPCLRWFDGKERRRMLA